MRPELQDIVDEVSRLLERPATLEDRHFNMIAFGSHGGEIDQVRQQSILRRRSTAQVRQWFEQFGISTSDRPVRTPAFPDQGILPRLCLPARWNGVTYGYVWLLDDQHDTDAARMPAAMALAGRAGVLMAQQSRARDDLEFKVQDLLSPNQETAEQAAAEIDRLAIIRRGTPVAVVELNLALTGTERPVPINLWSLPRTVLTSTGGDHTTLLVPAPGHDLGPARDAARRARELYAEQLDAGLREHLVAGIGAPRPDLAAVRASWLEARLAARICQAAPRLRPVASWSELGVYRLLACGPEATLAGAVLDPAVRRLLETGDHELIGTAITYLGTGGKVQDTAATLNVHRQTIYHRLHRIEQVTELDLSHGDHRLLLHLGLTLAPLLRGACPDHR
jgi:sugar diacid utilization regulator